MTFGYVGYRDHYGGSSGWDGNYPVTIQKFTNGDNCYKFIEKVSANGGADTPEAVVDGFKAVTELNWEKETLKFVFHIADAPPHGI